MSAFSNALMEKEKNINAQAMYGANQLLNALRNKLQLKNDVALSQKLRVAPPIISKIRHGNLPIGATLLIRMNEASGLTIRELRSLMGDHREYFYPPGKKIPLLKKSPREAGK